MDSIFKTSDANDDSSDIDGALDHEAEILVLGCGMSPFSEQIYKDGFECITNLDFSETSTNFINSVMEKEGKMDQFDNMEYLCMDICDIDKDQEDRIEEDSYDLVIDKACLDCIACHNDPSRIHKAIRNIHRVLVNGGTYFLLSRAHPQVRMS